LKYANLVNLSFQHSYDYVCSPKYTYSANLTEILYIKNKYLNIFCKYGYIHIYIFQFVKKRLQKKFICITISVYNISVYNFITITCMCTHAHSQIILSFFIFSFYCPLNNGYCYAHKTFRILYFNRTFKQIRYMLKILFF